eukprot:TRINITY_DN1144_c0_g2_i1.p1 TRINITY_DN1144_c0_g2~~TRINITY_DN1144_c0_g2_i1.p1  ORF type:complete len:180 (+),score=38.45 TRINITY_DN1144_c0_g2_i1:36-542(+)
MGNETSGEIGEEGAKWRQKGNKAATLRNQAYADSQAAYKRGDKALAKELSDKGKQYQKDMEDAHRKAANAIFKSKNSDRGVGEIDLHGLRKEEAIERLEKRLKKCELMRQRKLVIITGKGIHSNKKKGAVIKPVVKKYLAQKKYEYTIKDRNDGCIVVEIGAAHCILF